MVHSSGARGNSNDRAAAELGVLIWVVMLPLGPFSKSEGRDTGPKGHILRVAQLTRATGPSLGSPACWEGELTSQLCYLLDIPFSPRLCLLNSKSGAYLVLTRSTEPGSSQMPSRCPLGKVCVPVAIHHRCKAAMCAA